MIWKLKSAQFFDSVNDLRFEDKKHTQPLKAANFEHHLSIGLDFWLNTVPTAKRRTPKAHGALGEKMGGGGCPTSGGGYSINKFA